jgi:hypothetical protein
MEMARSVLEIAGPGKRAFQCCGTPGSYGPSTMDGQQIELLHYVFEWAGPDVP